MFAQMAAAARAMRKAGQVGLGFRTMRMRPTVRAASPAACALKVGSAAQSAGIFSISGPGSAPGSVRPRSSLTWLAAMMMAMPEVKPTVTGCGTYLM